MTLPSPKSHAVGSFAPPLTTEKLADFRELAKTAGIGIRESMESLCTMLEVFWQTPESKLQGQKAGIATVIPLEDAEISRIWDYVPWSSECDTLGALFDTIDPVAQKPLRDAAYHLLWYARELTLDREPITTDKLDK